MKSSIIFVIFLLVSLVGCYVSTDSYSVRDPIDRASHPLWGSEERMEILESETIAEKTFIASVKAGDTIYLTVYGEEIKPIFFTSKKVVASFWKELECYVSPTIDKEICKTIKRKGQCELIYRKQGDEIRHPIFFDPANYPLQLVLGEGIYPIQDVKSESERFQTTFVVTEEMLQNGHDLYLDISPNGTKGAKTKVGLLKYRRCDGKGSDGFYVDAHTATQVVEVIKEYVFTVSVSMNAETIDDGNPQSLQWHSTSYY